MLEDDVEMSVKLQKLGSDQVEAVWLHRYELLSVDQQAKENPMQCLLFFHRSIEII